MEALEYELVNWELREVWRCEGECGRYRHRIAITGLLPAICCGKTARFVDRFKQPVAFIIESPLPSAEL